MRHGAQDSALNGGAKRICGSCEDGRDLTGRKSGQVYSEENKLGYLGMMPSNFNVM